jgi:hypothetical protein
VDEKAILGQVDRLIAEEHELRAKVQSGELDSAREQERLREVEASLDQCWDLLRQRRAKRQYGEDPDEAAARPEQEVENYLQ